MSELVRKVHALKKDVFDLEELLRQWKQRYAAEVNHAEDLSRALSGVHLPCEKSICSVCDVLDSHEQRRLLDLERDNDWQGGDA
jgi:hypothetical protein